MANEFDTIINSGIPSDTTNEDGYEFDYFKSHNHYGF